VASTNLELVNHLDICLKTEGNQENLCRVGRSQNLPDAHWLLASNSANKRTQVGRANYCCSRHYSICFRVPREWQLYFILVNNIHKFNSYLWATNSHRLVLYCLCWTSNEFRLSLRSRLMLNQFCNNGTFQKMILLLTYLRPLLLSPASSRAMTSLWQYHHPQIVSAALNAYSAIQRKLFVVTEYITAS
jgi:hypothetical protein